MWLGEQSRGEILRVLWVTWSRKSNLENKLLSGGVEGEDKKWGQGRRPKLGEGGSGKSLRGDRYLSLPRYLYSVTSIW